MTALFTLYTDTSTDETYEFGTFRALRPLIIAEAFQEFRGSQWVTPATKWSNPSVAEFINWLKDKGWIEPVDVAFIGLGNQDGIRLSQAAYTTELKPEI